MMSAPAVTSGGITSDRDFLRPRRHPMITATVRYKLPPHIDYAACREHFHKIASGFREAKGLISKHFIWSESGWAGGVYQWERIEDAKAVARRHRGALRHETADRVLR